MPNQTKVGLICVLVFASNSFSLYGQEKIPRILNGEVTADFDSVGIVGSLDRGGFCTGTLISPRHVLTAGHCAEVIEDDQSGTFEINGQIYFTSSILIHPDFNSFNLDNDLAILELSEPVADVVPSQIFRGSPMEGEILTIVGFGGRGDADGSDGTFGTKVVGETEIQVVTDVDVIWEFDDPQEANTSPGDSGGPGFLLIEGEFQIASVTSGGTVTDAALGDTAFNVRVDAYADWIDFVVETALPIDPEAPVEEPTDPEVPVEEPTDPEVPVEEPTDPEVPVEEPTDPESPVDEPCNTEPCDTEPDDDAVVDDESTNCHNGSFSWLSSLFHHYFNGHGFHGNRHGHGDRFSGNRSSNDREGSRFALASGRQKVNDTAGSYIKDKERNRSNVISMNRRSRRRP